MMVLYICETCGRWQDVSLAVTIVNAWNNAFAKVRVPTHEEEGVPCPTGCGLMRLVTASDRLMIQTAYDTQEPTPIGIHRKDQ